MIQVVYEYAADWPEEGPLQVNVPPFSANITVSPDAARRRANGYLVTNVSMTLHATNPVLIMSERPVWRLSLDMRVRGMGYVATLGSLDIDAQTRDVLPLTATQIRTIQDQANALITRLTPETAPAI